MRDFAVDIFVLLIGTFQAETDEEIAYGLVHPLASWEPIWTQVRLIVHKANGPYNVIWP